MAQVATTMNGRTYRLSCEDGEERRLQDLSAYVEERFAKFADDFGQVGQDRLMLLTALALADEIFEQREQLDGAARTAAAALRDAVKGAKEDADAGKSAAKAGDDESKAS